jgi:catechol 2,3-dioxygenase-like lactoylglutathione lyase family enzyme
MAMRPTAVFINLSVRDLKRSVEFFRELGFEFDSGFTDCQATCTSPSPFPAAGGGTAWHFGGCADPGAA